MSEEPRNTMEGRARRRASQAGIHTKAVSVEPEPPPTKRHELGARVAVVYYLCRNHHLEHPHFMEVPLASPQGLYLRDVISRLDALRGKGMAAKYSWSCKRSYKNGFVWHDLSVDDLLLPTEGTEYVLKGSKLPFDQSKPPLLLPDRQQSNTTSNAKVQLPRPTRQQESPHSPGSSNQGWTSTSASPTPTTYTMIPAIQEAAAPPPRAAVVSATKEAVPPPLPQTALLSSPSAFIIGGDEQCRMPPHSGSSSNTSPKTSMPSSSASSPSLNKPGAGHDAATQTDGKNAKLQHRQDTPERPEIVHESRSMPPPAGEYPRSRRSGTLQSLIRAEAAGRRGLLEEHEKATTGSVSGRHKPASLLMRLMACGPSHPGLGFVQTSYRPRFTRHDYPLSSELSPVGALKPGTIGASTARASEAGNSGGRLHDSGAGKLKRSSPSRTHQEGVCQEARSSKGDSVCLSRSAGRRMSGPSSGRTPPSNSKVVSFHDE